MKNKDHLGRDERWGGQSCCPADIKIFKTITEVKRQWFGQRNWALDQNREPNANLRTHVLKWDLKIEVAAQTSDEGMETLAFRMRKYH